MFFINQSLENMNFNGRRFSDSCIVYVAGCVQSHLYGHWRWFRLYTALRRKARTILGQAAGFNFVFYGGDAADSRLCSDGARFGDEQFPVLLLGRLAFAYGRMVETW